MAPASTSTPVSSVAGPGHPERRSFSFPRPVSWSVLCGYDLHDLRPVDAMKRIPPRPVLLIYGLLELPEDSDRRPQLKAALPDAELWVVPGAAHTGAYTLVPQPYLQKVGAFFERTLK